MGAGGVGAWEVETLVALEEDANLMENILSCRWAGQQEDNDQNDWYEWIIQELNKAPTYSLSQYFEALDNSISLETAVELFQVSDHFDVEESLNSDGFFTYVRVINSLEEANRLAACLDRFRNAITEFNDEEAIDVVEDWGVQLIELECFLRQISHKEKTVIVQLVSGTS